MSEPTSWHSYPKLYAIGHRALAELLLDDVVEELLKRQFETEAA